MEFGTKGRIYKLQTANGWTYDGCNSCTTKPRVRNGQLYCGGCKTYIIEMGPKFRVHYIVANNTREISVAFFDRHMTELLDTTTSTLKDALKQYRNTSLKVSQFSRDEDELKSFTYTDEQVLKHSDMKEASQTQSCQVSDTDAMQTTPDTCPSIGFTSKALPILDLDSNDLPIANLFNTPASKGKKRDSCKTLTNDGELVGISEMKTPKLLTTKPARIIKKRERPRSFAINQCHYVLCIFCYENHCSSSSQTIMFLSSRIPCFFLCHLFVNHVPFCAIMIVQ
ncbi:uncharacterized protein LOC129285489 [Prosopis cineraria]|uniref:uncharacterized protein LOC129285489 n=1 Tax=Prosopis cineraria TaxID=364024 RepID=UPI0024102EB6|nr:uncharacterized protein LOC129285489 [Prosopis cineraria]